MTGAAGFVGRHFARYLADQGVWVLGVDVKPEPDGFPGVYVRADLRDVLPRDDRAVDARPFDVVVHAAAIVGGRAMIEGQPLKVATDLAIDSDLFQWAVRTKPARVLYFSSSAAYPVALQDATGSWRDEDSGKWSAGWRLREDDIEFVDRDPDDVAPWVPDQSYGWVKLTGEMLAGLARAEGVPVTVVRPFSGYGTDQDRTYPFPAFIERAQRCAAGERRFPIWGDGRQVRDFVHVDDVVRACFAIIDSDTCAPVNICTGRPVSFNRLAGMMLDQVGAPRGRDRVELVHELDAPVGVAYRVGDPTLMARYYQPRVSLTEGIERALRGVL